MCDAAERDYVLGTDDPEIKRLGVQHALWRERALSAWRRAGLKRGATAVDVGCGPGYATLDLAELVGPEGKVYAVDRSRRFLDALEEAAAARGFGHIETIEADVDALQLPEGVADLVWVRWLLIFAPRPEHTVARAAAALKPGGAFVAQEYLDYGTWRFIPDTPSQQAFAAAVVKSWRAHGGDPDVGRRLPAAFSAAGLAIEALDPLVYVVRPDEYLWVWVKSWIDTSGPDRLVELGYITVDEAAQLRADVRRMEDTGEGGMVTPMIIDARARAPR